MGDTATQFFGELVRDGSLEIGDGYRAKLNELGGGGPFFLRAGALTDAGFVWSGLESFTSAALIANKRGFPGDVVITTKGNSVGRVGQVPKGAPDFAYSPHLSYWRSLDAERVNARYLYYWARSVEFTTQLRQLAFGTDMAPYFSLRDQLRLKISLPSPTRQQAVAEVLGALDDKLAASRRVEAGVRALLAVHFESMGIDQEPSTGAATAQVGDLIELNPRETLQTVGDVPYLEMKNLPDTAMTVCDWSSRSARGGARFKNGDTLLARITPCLENGKTGFVDFLAEDEIGVGSTEFIVMRPRQGVPAVFPFFLAKSPKFREFAIKHLVGTSGRQRLSATDVARYAVKRPDDGALAGFGALADPLMNRVRSCVVENRALASTRDELLPLLMSGKIRVKDAEAVASEVL